MQGFIAESGSNGYRHRFGGSDWTILFPEGASPAPALLLTLDARDPRLGLMAAMEEIPLCSRLDGAMQAQAYSFAPDKRVVTFDGPSWNVQQHPDDLLPTPLPQRELRLRSLRPEEDASQNEDASDTFVGGPSFLRVRGNPLWLEREETVACTCGRQSEYLASVGYEVDERASGILPPRQAFFIGELALYFLGCLTCCRVTVISQST